MLTDFFFLFPTIILPVNMSAYDNVVVGKLKLKGKALDVKAGSMKKKKKHKKLEDQKSLITEDDLPAGRLSSFCQGITSLCSIFLSVHSSSFPYLSRFKA